MNKRIIDYANADEISEWIYPQINLSDETVEEEVDEKKEQEESDFKKAEAEYLSKLQELEYIKQGIVNQIALFNRMISLVETSLSTINEDFINFLNSIIKIMVKKIILKEIETDPNILKKMISELVELINDQTGLVTVNLSESDFERLKTNELNKLISIKADPSLHLGDITVKSNFSEVHAILTDRLDTMLGTKEDGT